MTLPTYEEWGKKVAEQAIDVYTINGRTIREWIEILSDELTMLNKIRAEIENHCGLTKENHCRYCSYCNSVMGVREIIEIIDKYREGSE